MTLRVLYAVGGIVTAYAAAHGLLAANLMLDLGRLTLFVAIVAGLRTEHSLRAGWPAFLLSAALYSAIELPSFGLPSCASAAVPCSADPNARCTAVVALLGLFGAVGWAMYDLRRRGARGLARGTRAASPVREPR
ncbi:MAG: hypothetical protein NVS9B11_11850 [Candidatus Dormibacteraceae bacterium]